MLEGDLVVVSFAGGAAVAVALGQFERALVVGERETAFFGKDDVFAAFVVLFA